MIHNILFAKLKRLHQRLNGLTIEYNLEYYYKILDLINNYGIRLKKKTDNQLKQLFQKLIIDCQHNNILQDELLIQSFALTREVAWRTISSRPFDVQIIGGIALHQGKLIEMQTGEGKTLTAVFPACLNALNNNGVHVLTFNDYLAKRDANWMRPIYEFAGLNVAYIQEGMSIARRQKAYQADITYVTAKEAGFDFLRDSLCYRPEDRVHRKFHFAIIDEADSILIDEARIPLIIAGTSEEHIANIYHLAEVVKMLDNSIDFEYDEYSRNIFLTFSGLQKAEELLKCNNLYSEQNVNLLIRLNCAIHAEFLLHRDVDYIVRDDKIELIDEFTGRVVDKRRWPDGLQAALEAKEKIAIQSRGQILNSTTIQHFVAQYPKLCGMTATARSAANEFKGFYNLDVVVIPPNKPCIRIDHDDLIFSTRSTKMKALINEIINIHDTKRPILVGTRSVEESISLSNQLKNHGVECEVLNAKNNELEAEIIAQAGRLGAVTISTNMAGRGTDIKLGGSDESEKPEVIALGGLYVIGTNKHESQRIDNQLRGRAGRQGDPGTSRFFTSLEDDLFIKYRIEDLLPENMMNNQHTDRIEHPVIRREIDRIQRIIEGQNYEIKKTLYQYSYIIEKQRQILSEQRYTYLNKQAAIKYFESKSPYKFNQYKSAVAHEHLNTICQKILLCNIDKYWSQYLAEIADIREGIHLKSLGGQVPLIEFQKLSIEIFDKFNQDLDNELIRIFDSLEIKNAKLDLTNLGIKAPAATWTYTINDKFFENQLGMQLIGNIGTSAIAAFMYGPLLALYPLFLKLRKKRK